MSLFINIIADAIMFQGDAVARITVKEGTLRDRFIDAIQGENAAGFDDFIEALKREAKTKSQAGAITLEELNDILDELVSE